MDEHHDILMCIFAGFESLTRNIFRYDVERQGFTIPPIIGLIGFTAAVGAVGFAQQSGLQDTLLDAINDLISKSFYTIYLRKRGFPGVNRVQYPH